MGKEYIMCVYSLYIRLRETILTKEGEKQYARNKRPTKQRLLRSNLLIDIN